MIYQDDAETDEYQPSKGVDRNYLNFKIEKIIKGVLMRTIVHCLDELRLLIGDEILLRELEGILRKHQALHERVRSAGRVEICLNQVIGMVSLREPLPPARIARLASSHSLSQASVYRLCHRLKEIGVPCRAVQILREMDRLQRGIY